MSKKTVTEWPALNSLSWLRLPCCANEHPTRVEDYEDDHVLVGSPSAPHAKPVAPPDEEFFLGWVIPGGALEVPVKLIGQREQPISMWMLEAIGPAVETQRRQFVRVEASLEVRLLMFGGTTPMEATTLDVSEGGLRCLLGRWVIDPKESAFDIELPVKDRTFNLRGQVAWWGPLNANEQRVVGIRFLDTEPKVADDLRAFVFRTQIEQRRSSQ